MSDELRSTLIKAIIPMWNAALDFATSDDFKKLSPEERDKVYLTYQANVGSECVIQIEQAFKDAGYMKCTEVTAGNGKTKLHAHWLEDDGISHNIRPNIPLRMSHKVQLHVKARIWNPIGPSGFKEYDNTWTPQVLVPHNRLHIPLDSRDKSFVEIELFNEGDDLMTGQEWYDRFVKQAAFDYAIPLHDNLKVGEGKCAIADIVSAAKKASGIKDA
jgi:hypothetical protein